MRTIGFFSYRSAKEKTQALANFGRHLAKAGHPVFALDLDLESPGLHCQLLDAPEHVGPGALEFLHRSIYQAGHDTPSLADHVHEIPVQGDGAMHLMPAGRALSAEYAERLAHFDWHALVYATGGGEPHLRDLFAQIEHRYRPDYLLIDTRTGITPLTSLILSRLADKVVVPFTCDEAELDGSFAVVAALARVERPPRAVVPVLCVEETPKSDEATIAEWERKKRLARAFAAQIEWAGGSLETMQIGDVAAVHLDQADPWNDYEALSGMLGVFEA